MDSACRRMRFFRVLRIFLVVFALVLSIEIAILILDPFHLLSAGNIAAHISTLPFFIFAHNLILAFILILEVVGVLLIAVLLAKPLAIRAYLREVRKAQEQKHLLYFPLEPDLVLQEDAHLMLLGVPGAGKTMVLCEYQYETVTKQRWAILLGRKKLPIYVPMRSYSLFVKSLPQTTSDLAGTLNEEETLLPFLLSTKPGILENDHSRPAIVQGKGRRLPEVTEDLPGIYHLQPYLKSLVEQGHILFLCDGLNEIDSSLLARVCVELTSFLQQTENRFITTCREVDYHELQQLTKLVNDNAMRSVLVNPLEDSQIDGFIEKYISQPDKNIQHTQEEILQVINGAGLRPHCTNPMMLSRLIDVIGVRDRPHGKQFDTRGRLMREYVSQLIEREREKRHEATPKKEEVLLFFSEVACFARRANARNAIELDISLIKRGVNRSDRVQELADTLQIWLFANNSRVPFLTDASNQFLADSIPLHEKLFFDRDVLPRLLEFAWSARLIEINSKGELNFPHEMIAEYLVAEYFCEIDRLIQLSLSHHREPLPLDEDLFVDYERWREVVLIWAGLVEDSKVLAERFAAFGNSNPRYRARAVVYSMICMGVLWTPAYLQTNQAILPTTVQALLMHVVREKSIQLTLAKLFDGCAQAGGKEVYRSLLPLITLDCIEDLLVLLDKKVVPELLFEHLKSIVEDSLHKDEVERLIGVLGRFGAVSVEPAAQLSLPNNSLALRHATIMILGYTHEESAVKPLIACLLDSDTGISQEAAVSLTSLEPKYALLPVMEVLNNHTLPREETHVHCAALKVLKNFLDEKKPERQIDSSHCQLVLETIVRVFSPACSLEAHQKARAILAEQGRALKKGENGKKTIEILLRKLSVGNRTLEEKTMAHNVIETFVDIGPIATQSLLDNLPKQISDVARRRIIEIFTRVRDLAALQHMFRYLEDPSEMVHRQVASALKAFAPESISGLIEIILRSDSKAVALQAEQILADIGDEVVGPVSAKIFPIVSGRTDLLVRVLEVVRNAEAIDMLIQLLEDPLAEASLIKLVIHSLGQFQDKRVVPPLVKMLTSSNSLHYKEASTWLTQLGESIQIRDIVVNDLVVALGAEYDAMTLHRIRLVLCSIHSFPGKQLIDKVAHANNIQVEHIKNVFLMKGEEGARILAANLHHSEDRTRSLVRQALEEEPSDVIVPVMVNLLNVPALYADCTEFLLKHPKKTIQRLVATLSDSERRDAAKEILFKFGPQVLPYMIPGLDNPNSTAYARQIVVNLIFQKPVELSQVVQLLKPPLPERAKEVLLDMLTSELAIISVSALTEGLATQDLIAGISEAMNRLVQKGDVLSSAVLKSLRDALRNEKQQRGAASVLVKIGAPAVPIAGELITDPIESVALSAQYILQEIGGPALPFIWVTSNETSNQGRRALVLKIFHNMETTKIKATLVELLTSDKAGNIAAGVGLLLERVIGEQAKGTEREIIPALLKYVHTYNNDLATRRIIGWLLVLGGSIAVDSLTKALQDNPNHQEQFTRAFLLLGEEAEAPLKKLLNQSPTPSNTRLRAEAAGILGMIAEYPEVSNRALAISTNGYNDSALNDRARIVDTNELQISLRALGGLLAGGTWQIAQLERQRRSSTGKPEDELFNILLGKLYTPVIEERQRALDREREIHQREVERLNHEKEQMQLDFNSEKIHTHSQFEAEKIGMRSQFEAEKMQMRLDFDQEKENLSRYWEGRNNELQRIMTTPPLSSYPHNPMEP